MASLTRWIWVWVDSGSWWWTGKPGVLQSKGSQRVGHDWVTELNWVYTCQCHSLDLAHPLLPPLCPQVCSLCLCLSSFPAYRFISTIFLDSIYMHSVQFSRSVVSDSLRPHELQHARPPCPSPTPGAYSNSCPLSWWCHPAISSSAVPFFSHLQSFPASGSFQMSQFFTSGGQSIGVSASTSVLQWLFRTDYL